MTRIKRWICDKYLPSYARESAAEEMRRLKARIFDLESENARLRAYIEGFERSTRQMRKIIINTGDKK